MESTRRKFFRAATEVTHLNHKLKEVVFRFNRATESGNIAYANRLRSRLIIISSIRTAFFTYIKMLAEELLEGQIESSSEED